MLPDIQIEGLSRVKDATSIWKGSSGPLFIRSVWIDNGSYHHFILDKEQKLTKSTSVTSSNKRGPNRNILKVQPFRQSKSVDDAHNLHLIGSSQQKCEITDHASLPPVDKKPSRKPQRFSFERLRRQIHENVNNKYSKKPERREVDSLINSNLSSLPVDGIHSDEKSVTPKIHEVAKNQLTERVLNWLDLAGKNTLIRPETAMPTLQQSKNKDDNCLQVPKRRILTTESLRNRVTTAVRRSESVHHLSLTLNENDLELCNNSRRFFEASSRCASALKFGEFFPTTYRCSRKFLASLSSARNNTSRLGITFPSVNNNFPGYLNYQTQMEQTSKSHNHSKKGKRTVDPMELKNMEKEYKGMIHRQILENSCNTQIAKRQLHIFMPNMPNNQQPGNQECQSSGVSGLSTILSTSERVVENVSEGCPKSGSDPV